MTGRDALGVFDLLIVAAVLGAISYAVFVFTPPVYDSQTLCLAGFVPPRQVVYVATTYLYSL